MFPETQFEFFFGGVGEHFHSDVVVKLSTVVLQRLQIIFKIYLFVSFCVMYCFGFVV